MGGADGRGPVREPVRARRSGGDGGGVAGGRRGARSRRRRRAQGTRRRIPPRTSTPLGRLSAAPAGGGVGVPVARTQRPLRGRDVASGNPRRGCDPTRGHRPDRLGEDGVFDVHGFLRASRPAGQRAGPGESTRGSGPPFAQLALLVRPPSADERPHRGRQGLTARRAGRRVVPHGPAGAVGRAGGGGVW